MDELLQDFLAETGENLEAAGENLVRFERDSSDAGDIASIFRLVHSIKGTCGFIGLPRLERLAHSAESVMALLRDGVRPLPATVPLVLRAVDRIRAVVESLARTGTEPSGDDEDLIAAILAHAESLASLRDPAPQQSSTEVDEGIASTPIEPVTAAPAEAAPVAEAQPQAPTPEPSPVEPAPEAGGARSTPRRHDSVRVSVALLESLMTLVSELVLTRNQLAETTRRFDDQETQRSIGRLSNLLSDLQGDVMRARMQPLERLFSSLTRLVHELGRELGKPIDLVVNGGEAELDRQMVEVIRDPLMHLIRNCADHGLESPAERLALGKPERGHIRVSAVHEAGSVVISVGDDGRGLDVERIRRKAMRLGLAPADELERMPDAAIHRFIFAPGFSTADRITTISGRGVGMDVVLKSLETIGGSVEIATEQGRFTTFSLKIPLTLAIAPALIVDVAGDRFAIPQTCVTEVVELWAEGAARLDRLGGALVLRLRQDVLPVCDLCEVLGAEPGRAAATVRYVVVMRVAGFRFGAIVDAVAETQEIVVKPLMPVLGAIDVFSGNTILGDGSVVLILDGGGLARRLDHRRAEERTIATVAPEAAASGGEGTRLILFRAGPGPAKALPLTLVTRIEMVPDALITRIDRGLAMQHGGRIIPLVPAAAWERAGAEEWPVLMVSVSGELMGILASDIIDIVCVPLNIDVTSSSEALIGSSQIGDEAVEVLDITHFMRAGRPEAFARGHNRRARILLVEDKPFFQDLIAPSLIAAGYDVTIASGAIGALATLRRSGPFDLVATDIEMPDMSGYALTRAIRADPRFGAIPVIGLASVLAPEVSSAAETAGMSRIISKLDRTALADALAALVAARMAPSFALERKVLEGHAA